MTTLNIWWLKLYCIICVNLTWQSEHTRCLVSNPTLQWLVGNSLLQSGTEGRAEGGLLWMRRSRQLLEGNGEMVDRWHSSRRGCWAGGRWSSANSKNINILQQGAKRIKGTELKHADCGGLCVQWEVWALPCHVEKQPWGVKGKGGEWGNIQEGPSVHSTVELVKKSQKGDGRKLLINKEIFG